MSAALLIVALIAGSVNDTLDRADAALAEFRPGDAVTILEGLTERGPLTHDQHVRLYEQLGIAYAYLEQSKDAIEAFSKMLALDPGRAISYTLSPKVTFVFEEARKKSLARPAPSVDVSWPRDVLVDQPVPVDVEVVADPEGFLVGARLYHRRRGAERFDVSPLVLPKRGERPTRVELPATAPDAKTSDVLELYLVATDAAKNEVLVFGSEGRPRQVSLQYEPPEPWYGKWWVWAIAGTVVAAGAGAAVFAATNEPPPTVGGTFEVNR
ncbi:MAG: tetratricopeptide repeat protein [Deltaproteobacteria bacterium]